jgi:hypothetical protein
MQIVESGLLPVGAAVGMKSETFGLDSIYDALLAAKQHTGWGTQVVLTPY